MAGEEGRWDWEGCIYYHNAELDEREDRVKVCVSNASFELEMAGESTLFLKNKIKNCYYIIYILGQQFNNSSNPLITLKNRV